MEVLQSEARSGRYRRSAHGEGSTWHRGTLYAPIYLRGVEATLTDTMHVIISGVDLLIYLLIRGSPLEQRTVPVAVGETRVLDQAKHTQAVLRILDQITATFERADDRRSGDFLALRKGLGYCCSVAVVALPDEGKALVKKWLVNTDPDVQWVMTENLKKTRLARIDLG